MNDFIALDFETANGSAASVCSVGMVKIIDNMMIETFYTLVNPETRFSESNIQVHGIRPEDVTGAPTFETVFPHMMDFIGNLPVVAHFATFDMNVLYQSITRYKQDMPTLTYFCSCVMARQTVKTRSHSLKNMMKYFNIDFKGHHHALNDAKACAMITVRLLKHYDSLEDYLKKNKKYLSSLKYKNSKKNSISKYEAQLLKQKARSENVNIDHPFYNKKVAITGTLHLPRKIIVQYIVDNGGTYTNVPVESHIFIHGTSKSGNPSKKETMVKNRIANGADIQLISKEKLEQLMNFYK